MSRPTVLIVAKSPEPGRAKTRVAQTVGDEVAADLAAAALLDTLEVAGSVGWPVVVALTGDLDRAARSSEIREALARVKVVAQRGGGFAERLVAAHNDADEGFGVVQVGMDSPQLAVTDLLLAGQALGIHDAAIAPAEDGGWWLLALRSSIHAKVLADVPMSTADTCRATIDALTENGAHVFGLRALRDVDTWADALALAQAYPRLRSSKVVRQVVGR
ncbi:MAG: DUF2064 domain-containing protein [Aeromicrobium sp.]